MTYLIVAVVLLIIIAPIVAVLPSKRQRKRMALRKKAMADGFTVEITKIDDPDPNPENYMTGTGKPLPRVMQCVAYRLHRKRPSNWRRMPLINWAVVRRAGAAADGLPDGWALDGELPAGMSNELRAYLLNNIGELPDDVVRVEEMKYVISCYWNEHGGDDALSSIVAFIKGCTEIQLHNPGIGSDPEA